MKCVSVVAWRRWSPPLHPPGGWTSHCNPITAGADWNSANERTGTSRRWRSRRCTRHWTWSQNHSVSSQTRTSWLGRDSAKVTNDKNNSHKKNPASALCRPVTLLVKPKVCILIFNFVQQSCCFHTSGKITGKAKDIYTINEKTPCLAEKKRSCSI